MPSQYTIGLITDIFDSQFTTKVINGIAAELRQRGCRLVCFQESPETILRLRLSTGIIDGWLSLIRGQGAQRLAQASAPMVLICASDGDLPSVWPDNRSGTLEVMQHLLSQGYRRIAFVGNLQNEDFRERLALYREQLAAAGCEYDPQLVVDPAGYTILEAYVAFQAALRRGLDASAVFCANDEAAAGVLRAAREAGLRVPHDLAVVGFDDMALAMYSEPPLSSVRQRPEELGRVALGRLLDILDGRGTPGLTNVPTRLVVRDSSRSGAQSPGAQLSADAYAGADWAAELRRDLVRVALDPTPLTANEAPERHWPSVMQLVNTLDRVLRGEDAGPIDDTVWREAIALTGGPASVEPVLEQLRVCAYRRFALSPGANMPQLVEWLLGCQRHVTSAWLHSVADQSEQQRAASVNDLALLTKLATNGADLRRLDWLESTRSDWGLLAHWEGESSDDAGQLRVLRCYDRKQGVLAMDRPVPSEQFPPFDLIPPELFDAGHIIKVAALSTVSRHWGFIATADPVHSLVYDPLMKLSAYISIILERDDLLDQHEARQLHLQATLDRERALGDTIRELGSPVIPLLPGVILVPLVGAIDEARAAQITERVLHGASESQATHVLLDITAVSVVDSFVANALVQTARAAGLLGARVLLVGVRPEIAQSIVSLNLNLGSIEAWPTLAAAIHQLTRMRAR